MSTSVFSLGGGGRATRGDVGGVKRGEGSFGGTGFAPRHSSHDFTAFSPAIWYGVFLNLSFLKGNSSEDDVEIRSCRRVDLTPETSERVLETDGFAMAGIATEKAEGTGWYS